MREINFRNIKRILFIDDEPSLVEMAPLLFENYHVLTALGANKIEELLVTFNPDIIFLDILIGDLDGAAICKELKSSQMFSHIPIVLMTAGFIREKDKECRADGFIEKPFDVEVLRALVRLLTEDQSSKKI